MEPPLSHDSAQDFLVDHLSRTEDLFTQAIHELAGGGSCQITPAADLCLPHDVIRLAGGFATGCLVQWESRVPIIPVDTTVNIDTSSIFWLDSIPTLDESHFVELRRTIEERSSFEWNFHKGNHFISIAQRASDGAPALVVHSNEKEFKYQFNGLMPVDGNWFMHDVRTFRRGGRYIRLLVGEKALLFAEIAKNMESFNVMRHRLIALALLDGLAKIVDDVHKHHYFMPTPRSVAIGCFICEPGETVPVFSRPGGELYLFEAGSGGRNTISLDGRPESLLVPHGFGKTMNEPVECVFDEHLLAINGQAYEVKPLVSLGTHPHLIVREFDSDSRQPGSLFSRMKTHTPGVVVDRLVQLASYSRLGFCEHHEVR